MLSRYAIFRWMPNCRSFTGSPMSRGIDLNYRQLYFRFWSWVHSTAGHQRRLNFLDWSSPPGKNSRDTYYRSPELRLVHSTWLNSTDLWEVDPRRVHWSHASASRLYLVLIGCSETRTASARSVLKTCDMYSNAAVHTGDRELEFSSVHVLWTSLYFLSLSCRPRLASFRHKRYTTVWNSLPTGIRTRGHTYRLHSRPLSRQDALLPHCCRVGTWTHELNASECRTGMQGDWSRNFLKRHFRTRSTVKIL